MKCDPTNSNFTTVPFWMQNDRPGLRKASITETVSDPSVIADDPDAAKAMNLKRGQYRVRGRFAVDQMPDDAEKMLITGVEVPLRIGNEYKRVTFHKIDIQPPRMVDGNQIADYTLVFTIQDNLLPLAPIIWGAAATSSLVAGWFFVDKVESFSQTGAGSLAMIALSAAALFLVFPSNGK